MSNRLNSFIGEYIHKNQIGFISKRNITDNIRKTINTIYYCSKSKKDNCILALDIEKAFDQVEPLFLQTEIKEMGFGTKFQTVVHSLYTAPIAQLNVNGLYSQNFLLTRGTRQGCPLAPLFALILFASGSIVRNSINIKGITINHCEYKISLFADDLVLYLSEPLESIPDLESMLQEFERFSGLNSNRSKSIFYPMNMSPDLTGVITTKFSYQ